MRRKVIGFGLAALLFFVLGLVLLKTERLFLSWETAVNDPIANILAHQKQQLPQEPIDLAMITSSRDVNLYDVTAWQVQNVELANTVSLPQAIFDDDPIYSLKADLQITYASGEKAILSWESWRYGLVLGSRVISFGDGPPGYIVAVALP
jgi:hypothetical protein